jgi:amino acid transporter
VNKRQRGTLVLGTIVLITIFLFPPYFGIDPASQGRIHGPVGFHPAWAPPDQEYVSGVFVADGLIPEGAPEAPAMDIRVNKVLMVFEIIGLVLLTSAALFALRGRKRREEETE